MEPLSLAGLPKNLLLLTDSAPIIYVLEGHSRLAAVSTRYLKPNARRNLRLAVTTITLAEVMTGPLMKKNKILAERYQTTLHSWQVMTFDAQIAANAARIRAAFKLNLADPVQAASALAIGADALVTHDRDFSRMPGLRIIGT